MRRVIKIGKGGNISGGLKSEWLVEVGEASVGERHNDEKMKDKSKNNKLAGS